MSNIKVLGIDLAKNVFQLHGVDAKGACILRKRLSREQMVAWVANIPPCTIGIEACIAAHYWVRVFSRYGHTVKIMAGHLVKPYVKSNKNDFHDAAAIAEAVTRPDMKFVHANTLEQQDIQSLHRARSFVVKNRTAQANQIRGLLAEYGIFLPQGMKQIKQLMCTLARHTEKLTELTYQLFSQLYEQFMIYDNQVNCYEAQLKRLANHSVKCQALMEIEGIGVLTATAAVATIGDAKLFRCGREVAAWLGLVPRQHSSGQRYRLGGISKRGDRYLRTLLIQGARAVVDRCDKKTDPRSRWVQDKKLRCGKNKAAVALANKNARIIWAILASGKAYRRTASAAHLEIAA